MLVERRTCRHYILLVLIKIEERESRYGDESVINYLKERTNLELTRLFKSEALRSQLLTYTAAVVAHFVCCQFILYEFNLSVWLVSISTFKLIKHTFWYQ